jgi:ankyrin repeat protein
MARSVLHVAASLGSVDRLLQELDDDIDVNIRDDTNGDTPLHIALKNGHKEVSNVLLQNGASPTLENNLCETPWALAYRSSDDAFKAQFFEDATFQAESGEAFAYDVANNLSDGAGSIASVVTAYRKTDAEIYAVKMFELYNKQDERRFQKECEVMNR